MIILGIYPGHNAAVCVLRDGEVLVNLELERFTRRKHDYGYHPAFIQHVLASVGLSIADVDMVAVNGWGARKIHNAPPMGHREHEEFIADVLGRKILGVAINHHLAHAACAFFTSPFEQSAIITFDGGGDHENGSFSRGVGNRIEGFCPMQLEDLAGWWSGVTLNNYRMPRLHEWDPGSGAGKIMALAAYGKPDESIYEQLRDDMERNIFSPSYTDPHSKAFNNDEDLSDTKSPRAKNLAFALQSCTERVVRYMLSKSAHSNICYAGGIALNCIANSRALEGRKGVRLHVPPCPNDTGLALGMALFVWHHVMGKPRKPGYFSPYTGPEYDLQQLEVRPGCGLKSPVEPRDVAKLLADYEVVAVWRQRSECGPRALGHRSLLAHPEAPGMRENINFRIKRREWYRPFAPIVLAPYAHECLENDAPSPYMTTSSRITARWKRGMDAVCHVDGTTRPQILERAHEPFIYDVIDELGMPAVLNTSFNVGAPMVETPEQAVELFMATPGIKALVLDRHLLVKS